MKKSSAINEKLCQGKDIFERMNYLHQASNLIASKNAALASYYGSIMTGCAKKAVLRIEHHIKRSMCKKCQSPLIPGETAKVRLKSKTKSLNTICLACKKLKKIPINKKHCLWAEQPQALLEMFEYCLRKNSNNVKKDKTETNNLKNNEIPIA